MPFIFSYWLDALFFSPTIRSWHFHFGLLPPTIISPWLGFTDVRVC